jgi:hypothetical protein
MNEEQHFYTGLKFSGQPGYAVDSFRTFGDVQMARPDMHNPSRVKLNSEIFVEAFNENLINDSFTLISFEHDRDAWARHAAHLLDSYTELAKLKGFTQVEDTEIVPERVFKRSVNYGDIVRITREMIETPERQRMTSLLGEYSGVIDVLGGKIRDRRNRTVTLSLVRAIRKAGKERVSGVTKVA